MPTPDHKPHYEQSEELKALLAAQRPTPRWLYRLKRLAGVFDKETVLLFISSLVWIGVLLAILAALVSSANAAPYCPDRLLPALSKVESNGNPNARGDGNRAWGELQIWSVVVQDVNRVHGTRYVHADAFDRAKARDICRRYLAIYCTPRRLGRAPTMEDAARIWNGGPNGYRKSATEKYWHKVAQAL
jgi:hypothetical protein